MILVEEENLFIKQIFHLFYFYIKIKEKNITLNIQFIKFKTEEIFELQEHILKLIIDVF